MTGRDCAAVMTMQNLCTPVVIDVEQHHSHAERANPVSQNLVHHDGLNPYLPP